MTAKGRLNYRPQPVDFQLLELLPDKGMIGGVHWRGRQARDIRQEILDHSNGELTPDMLTIGFVQGRLRAMTVAGYVESFGGSGTGGKNIWARTPDGVAFLEYKDEVLGS